jgi:hypothetical protein
MPFTKSGLIPDIIINPNAIPKRMTIGQLVECLLAKICAIKGVYGDATPFTGVDINEINDSLVSAGFEEWANETMYNGMTGQKMNNKIFIGPTYYQRLKQMVGDKAHCLSTDHEVLTLEGWKFNHQLTMNDQIATLVDEKLVYQKPNKILNYPDYKGDMYHIKTQQMDLLVTPNHRMWVSKQNGDKWSDHGFELAKDIIGKRRKYKKDAIWDSNDYQFILPSVSCKNGIVYPDKKVDMDSWLTFFGTWISGGWIEKSNCVIIRHHKQQFINKLIGSIDKLGYQYRQDDDKIIINDKQLYTYMKRFNRAQNKSLPDWVWNLSSRQAKKLINGMVFSDKREFFGFGVSVYTSSDRLADDIMQLTLHAGWSSSKRKNLKEVSINTEQNISSNHDIQVLENKWRLEICRSEHAPEVNHGYDVNHRYIEVQNTQTEEIIKGYNKPVFCLEVNGGVFYVRRNGRAVWTGNSRARGPTQLLTRQPPEGYMEVYIFIYVNQINPSHDKIMASSQIREQHIQIAGNAIMVKKLK